MVKRDAETVLRKMAGLYPVVTVTGPRQSGKTTICRKLFPRKPYLNLEQVDHRQYVTEDPRGFLADHPDGAIVDEVQHAPELLGYLQVEVDERPKPGRFVLTGSQHFGLSAAVSQSLAGRSGVLHLLSLSLGELRRFESTSRSLLEVLFTGGYPAIPDRGIPPERWLADYVTNYVQRDVRQVLNVGDLTAFTTFAGLVAGRAGQELNLSGLGGDAGVSHNTARSWLSVLETSFICFRVPAWHRNLRKRLVKAPKLHFYDSGLLCNLLGIRDPDHLRHHPARGAVFESWVASEIVKHRLHRGLPPDVHHLRQVRGLEIDLIVEGGKRIELVEAKSGATVDASFLRPLLAAMEDLRDHAAGRSLRALLVHGGEAAGRRQGVELIPWSGLDRLAPGD